MITYQFSKLVGSNITSAAGFNTSNTSKEIEDFLLLKTGPGAHPASCIMGTGSFSGVKRPERGVDHPPNLAQMLKKE
jgi:hypothetical protein